ncbi:hypothetical protein HNQ88_001561 [Aureibacter tunicatorum]|uniref:Uncharacterized protein n=1 Tax=Aureibacter tunicatorum TaxID=866807 RepID=A0AAE4BPZ5_9BACT|nr:hypothetical protein [Aureibacter tunicatorum]
MWNRSFTHAQVLEAQENRMTFLHMCGDVFYDLTDLFFYSIAHIKLSETK